MVLKSFILLSLLLSNVFADSLVSIRSCASLQKYMISNALKRVGPYGLGNQIWLKRGPITLSGPSQFETTDDSAPTEGTDFSGTNVQVAGVDEPDIVKTDGEKVFALKGKEFYYVKSKSEGMNGEVIAKLKLPSFGREMLFSGNYVVVISNTFDFFPVKPLPQSMLTEADITPRTASLILPFRTQNVVLYKLFIGQSNVQLIQTLRIPGRYIGARLVDDNIRLITTYDGSNSISFVYPSTNVSNEEATEKNKEIIRRTSLSTWLPTYTTNGTDCKYKGESTGKCSKYSSTAPITSCKNIYVPKGQFSGFSFLSVSSLRLSSSPLTVKSVSIIADGDKVYSNINSLYVATTEYQFDLDSSNVRFGASFKSSFHKFSFTKRSNRVDYIASGEVSGSVLNQFSMHEYKNIFFIATTDGAPWWGARDTSSSKVTAFKVQSSRTTSKLVKTSEVGNLGLGERIFAVRYIKDKAYVVTFRQVDPLYIVVLSDIYHLKVTGELKIPGYSAYLHPIGEDKLLGVGREATPEGRTTGAKVSLFDISDISNPIEVDNWSLKGSYTNAEWDHRAFLYWPPAKVAVLPISVYSQVSKERFFGSVVLDVGGEIAERGRISHKCCGSDFQRSIKRNFVLGRTNLWSLSSDALQVNAIDDLTIKASIPLGYEKE